MGEMKWMKWRWAALIAAFILFVGGSYLSDIAVLRSVEDLEGLASSLEAAVAQSNWSGAQAVLDGIWRKWPAVRRNWDLRMHRDEMDDLDLALVRMSQFLAEQDKAGVASELGVWQMLLTHVAQKEVFQWRNLL